MHCSVGGVGCGGGEMLPHHRSRKEPEGFLKIQYKENSVFNMLSWLFFPMKHK